MANPISFSSSTTRFPPGGIREAKTSAITTSRSSSGSRNGSTNPNATARQPPTTASSQKRKHEDRKEREEKSASIFVLFQDLASRMERNNRESMMSLVEAFTPSGPDQQSAQSAAQRRLACTTLADVLIPRVNALPSSFEAATSSMPLRQPYGSWFKAMHWHPNRNARFAFPKVQQWDLPVQTVSTAVSAITYSTVRRQAQIEEDAAVLEHFEQILLKATAKPCQQPQHGDRFLQSFSDSPCCRKPLHYIFITNARVFQTPRDRDIEIAPLDLWTHGDSKMVREFEQDVSSGSQVSLDFNFSSSTDIRFRTPDAFMEEAPQTAAAPRSPLDWDCDVFASNDSAAMMAIPCGRNVPSPQVEWDSDPIQNGDQPKSPESPSSMNELKSGNALIVASAETKSSTPPAVSVPAPGTELVAEKILWCKYDPATKRLLFMVKWAGCDLKGSCYKAYEDIDSDILLKFEREPVVLMPAEIATCDLSVEPDPAIAEFATEPDPTLSDLTFARSCNALGWILEDLWQEAEDADAKLAKKKKNRN